MSMTPTTEEAKTKGQIAYEAAIADLRYAPQWSDMTEDDHRSWGRAAAAILTAACKPWESYTGEPPDDGGPLIGVFVAGMVYTERLLAKLLSVRNYEGGDAAQTLRNILTGAGLWDADENRPVSPAPSSPGVPDSVREAVRLLDEIRSDETKSMEDGRAIRRIIPLKDRAETLLLDFVRTLISAHPAGQSEHPILRATVDVFADRTDTRLSFGDRTAPDLGVKAVQQAIAALAAEYEARGGCPVVGRQPAGQSTGQGAETDALVDRFAVALKAKLRVAEAKYGWRNGWLQNDWAADCQRELMRHVGKGDPLDVAAYAAFCWHHGWPTAPDSTRTGQVETIPVSVELVANVRKLASSVTGDAYLGNEAETELAQEVDRALLAAERAALAARPAAPEAQGAWCFNMKAAPRDGTVILLWREGWGGPSAAYWGLAPMADGAGIATKRHPWVFLDSTNGVNGYEDGRHGPMAWHPMLDAPAPPASSGQESA